MSAKRYIYHFTHVKHLKSIIHCNALWSDARMRQWGGVEQDVGMSHIKERRLQRPVSCNPATYVGQYVPFYFCPRSVMLYILHKGNHPQVSYKGGQRPLIHLVADLDQVLDWTEQHELLWAFSFSNASSFYVEFCNNRGRLHELNWQAIMATDFRHRDIQEQKQAELLVYDYFPLQLIQEIGVLDGRVRDVTAEILRPLPLADRVIVRREWYY